MPDYGWPDAEHRALIGKRISRVDSPFKVSGRAKYTYDYHAPDMLFGKVVRSPYAKAKIVSIDTSAAEKLPGVKAVQIIQKPGATVQWAGDDIVAVAAVDESTAEDAARLIMVKYQPLPYGQRCRAPGRGGESRRAHEWGRHRRCHRQPAARSAVCRIPAATRGQLQGRGGRPEGMEGRWSFRGCDRCHPQSPISRSEGRRSLPLSEGGGADHGGTGQGFLRGGRGFRRSLWKPGHHPLLPGAPRIGFGVAQQRPTLRSHLHPRGVGNRGPDGGAAGSSCGQRPRPSGQYGRRIRQQVQPRPLGHRRSPTLQESRGQGSAHHAGARRRA